MATITAFDTAFLLSRCKLLVVLMQGGIMMYAILYAGLHDHGMISYALGRICTNNRSRQQRQAAD